MENNIRNMEVEQDLSLSLSLRSNGHPKSHWLQLISSEFEAKTKIALDLIGGDGDTFSERAEMYYQNRPKVIRTVHDLQKLYMTLAGKYEKLLSKTELSPIKMAFSDSSDSFDHSEQPGEAITCNVESMEDCLGSGCSMASSSIFEFQSSQNVLPYNTPSGSGFELTKNENGDDIVAKSRQEERRSSMTYRKKEVEPQEFIEENIRKDEKREKRSKGKNGNKFLKCFRSLTSPKGEKKAKQSASSKSKLIKGFFCWQKQA